VETNEFSPGFEKRTNTPETQGSRLNFTSENLNQTKEKAVPKTTISRINAGLLVVVIVLLGAVLSRRKPVEAQNKVGVIIQTLPANDAEDARFYLSGSQVVGVSCVPQDQKHDYPRCFVVSITSQGK